MALSPSGSSKRACAEVNNAVTCLVDGCAADLSGCRKYYQRHKVCERHSKSPQVSINRQNLRFCQQCSRFHSLEEFDEGKRSCRKRLDGHNRRRRRKPRPHLLPPEHGTNMLQFADQRVQVHPHPNTHPNMNMALMNPHLFPQNHGIDMLQSAGQQVQVHPHRNMNMALTNPLWSGVVEDPAWVDHLDYAPSLLSSGCTDTGVCFNPESCGAPHI